MARRKWTDGQPRQPSVCDGFPDQLSDIEEQVGLGLAWFAARANLAGAEADCVVQPAEGLAVGHVKHRPDDLRRLHKQGRETRKARGIILAACAGGSALAVVAMVAHAPWWAQCLTAAAASRR